MQRCENCKYSITKKVDALLLVLACLSIALLFEEDNGREIRLDIFHSMLLVVLLVPVRFSPGKKERRKRKRRRFRECCCRASTFNHSIVQDQ